MSNGMQVFELKERFDELETEHDELLLVVEDFEARLEELHSSIEEGGEKESIREEIGEIEEKLTLAQESLDDFLSYNEEEMDQIRLILKECDYDTYLIDIDYFENHAMDVCEEIHGSNCLKVWPFTCIDWKEAAKDLSHDYSAVDYDGNTYLYRQ